MKSTNTIDLSSATACASSTQEDAIDHAAGGLEHKASKMRYGA
jgi:hypothetical protein